MMQTEQLNSVGRLNSDFEERDLSEDSGRTQAGLIPCGVVAPASDSGESLNLGSLKPLQAVYHCSSPRRFKTSPADMFLLHLCHNSVVEVQTLCDLW
jgi:hypothetical protein